ncbi:hypothetical protein [Nocardioides convexus]|uniref:hypothetical protein n=1 Tax=Nocardioides convexus TaxID=2712224 RepID=UPI002418387D|nr:hypothetical protein [Nocardioides convexus]
MPLVGYQNKVFDGATAPTTGVPLLYIGADGKPARPVRGRNVRPDHVGGRGHRQRLAPRGPHLGRHLDHPVRRRRQAGCLEDLDDQPRRADLQPGWVPPSRPRRARGRRTARCRSATSRVRWTRSRSTPTASAPVR